VRRGLSLVEVIVCSFLVAVLGFVVLFAILYTGRSSRQNAQMEFASRALNFELESAVGEKLQVGSYPRAVQKNADGMEFSTTVVVRRPPMVEAKLQKNLLEYDGRIVWKDGPIGRELSDVKIVSTIHE
jgi:Tfp pilus assembly protein PilE